MRSSFKSTAADQDVRREENRWAEILTGGNPYAGIVLIYGQQLRTFADEIEMAFRADLIHVSEVEFYAGRLEKRIGAILRLLEPSDFPVRETFTRLAERVGSLTTDPRSYHVLGFELPEEISAANHELCDQLYDQLVRPSYNRNGV